MKFLAFLFLTGVVALSVPARVQAGTVQYYCATIYAPTAMAHDKDGDQVWIDDLSFAPGFTGRMHTHSGNEYLVVERGTATVTMNGKAPVTVASGSAIMIPANTAHTVANLSKNTGLDFVGFKVGSGAKTFVNVDKRKAFGCSVKSAKP